MPNDPTITAAKTSRLTALDGLRGIAALMVVFHHALLANPVVADATTGAAVGSARWLIQSTPLKIASAGTEAVVIFFVLSGMVLVLPVIKRVDFDWMSYYPRRVLRLYLPVAASIVFAAICILLYSQEKGAQVSNWIAAFSINHLTVPLFIQSLNLFGGQNYMNNPLWTLKWEMLFSLALPVFVVLGVWAAKRWYLAIIGALALVWVGNMSSNEGLVFLPVFLVGAVLAVRYRDAVAWADRSQSKWWWQIAGFATLIGGCLILVLPWWAGTYIPDVFGLFTLARSASLIGATMIVVAAFLWKPASFMLSIAPIRWLGRVSFSLYLVHAPILVMMANVFGPGQWMKTLLATVFTALIVAEIFTRLVEQPAHRLSKKVGAAASALVRRSLPIAPATSAEKATVSTDARV